MVTLPDLEERLAHALVHDIATPMSMMAAVVTDAAGPDADRRRGVAREGATRVHEIALRIGAALRTPLEVGSVDAATARTLLDEVWGELARPGDDLDAEVGALPLSPSTVRALFDDLVSHALAEGAGPRRVRVRTDHRDSTVVVVVDDDGPAPDPARTDPVRIVDGTAGASLVIAQRIAIRSAGAVMVHAHGDGTRVTVRWADAVAAGRGSR